MSEKKRGGFLAVVPLLLVVVAVLGSSCTPDSSITASESDIVATVFDKTAPWGTIKTYAMPDYIYHITGDTATVDDPNLSRQHDQLILDTIAQNFTNYGYTRIDTSEIASNPGAVVVIVSATAIQNFSIWGGWGWYPWWGWGPWWGYPCCPPTVTSFTIGTLLIQMADPEDADVGGKRLSALWHAGLNGVLEGSTQNVRNRLTSGINQAFKQSPYLEVQQ